MDMQREARERIESLRQKHRAERLRAKGKLAVDEDVDDDYDDDDYDVETVYVE